jgi:hypothetical protein
MLHEESDFIPALRITDETFVMPKSIFALEHRKRRMLVVVKWTQGSLADVFFRVA